jgi:iron complex transport system substrate-binding protein
MVKKVYFIAIAVIAIIVIASAGSWVYYQNTTPSPSPSPSTSPIVVTDDEGTNVTITQYPQRIVSLAPSNTQLLFAIGVGDKVVGVTDYDTYPYNFSEWIAAGNMTSIGGIVDPNKETVVSLQPDLILATPLNDKDVTTLRGLGYNVLVFSPADIAGVMSNIMTVGKATGAEDNATALVNSLNSQIDAITAKIEAAHLPKPKVYYETWYDSSGIMTIGSTCWLNDVIAKAGGVNIFANETEAYPTVSSETIVQNNPDIILIPTSMGSGVFDPNAIRARAGWNTVNAIKNDKIISLDGDMFQEVGPRVAEQVQAVAQALYPDLFN